MRVRAITAVALAALMPTLVGGCGAGGQDDSTARPAATAPAAVRPTGTAPVRRAGSSATPSRSSGKGPRRDAAGSPRARQPKAHRSPSGRKSDGLEAILEKLTRGAIGEKHGDSGRALERLLAQARREGARVIGADAGAAGNAPDGVGRILRALGAKHPHHRVPRSG